MCSKQYFIPIPLLIIEELILKVVRNLFLTFHLLVVNLIWFRYQMIVSAYPKHHYFVVLYRVTWLPKSTSHPVNFASSWHLVTILGRERGQGRPLGGNVYKMSGYAVNARILHTLLAKKCLFSDVNTQFNFPTQFEQISDKKIQTLSQ